MLTPWTVPLLAVLGLVIGPVGTVSGQPGATPAEIRFQHDTLRPGTAHQAGLIPDKIRVLRLLAESYLVPTADHPGRPAYAGAAVLAARNGIVVERFAVGDAVRYASATTELPAAQRVPARTDTLLAETTAQRAVMKGRPMSKGWLVVPADADINFWVGVAVP